MISALSTQAAKVALRKATRRPSPWYRKGAELGNSQAQANLALAYGGGYGTAPDPAAARLWAIKSAEQSNAEGLGILGDMYYHGRGGPQDLPQAVVLWTKSAQLGFSRSQFQSRCHV